MRNPRRQPADDDDRASKATFFYDLYVRALFCTYYMNSISFTSLGFGNFWTLFTPLLLRRQRQA